MMPITRTSRPEIRVHMTTMMPRMTSLGLIAAASPKARTEDTPLVMTLTSPLTHPIVTAVMVHPIAMTPTPKMTPRIPLAANPRLL